MKYLECAVCGKRIETNDDVFMCRDNFLQAKFFEETDGTDNIFCSTECADRAMSIEAVMQNEVPASAWKDDEFVLEAGQ